MVSFARCGGFLRLELGGGFTVEEFSEAEEEHFWGVGRGEFYGIGGGEWVGEVVKMSMCWCGGICLAVGLDGGLRWCLVGLSGYFPQLLRTWHKYLSRDKYSTTSMQP